MTFYCFQGLKTTKNTDLHIKILLRKCWTALLKILVLENKYKIVVPLFDAAYVAPNEDITLVSKDSFVCFVALRPKSTAMVMAGRSAHLTTLFPGQA